MKPTPNLYNCLSLTHKYHGTAICYLNSSIPYRCSVTFKNNPHNRERLGTAIRCVIVLFFCVTIIHSVTWQHHIIRFLLPKIRRGQLGEMTGDTARSKHGDVTGCSRHVIETLDGHDDTRTTTTHARMTSQPQHTRNLDRQAHGTHYFRADCPRVFTYVWCRRQQTDATCWLWHAISKTVLVRTCTCWSFHVHKSQLLRLHSDGQTYSQQ